MLQYTVGENKFSKFFSVATPGLLHLTKVTVKELTFIMNLNTKCWIFENKNKYVNIYYNMKKWHWFRRCKKKEARKLTIVIYHF